MAPQRQGPASHPYSGPATGHPPPSHNGSATYPFVACPFQTLSSPSYSYFLAPGSPAAQGKDPAAHILPQTDQASRPGRYRQPAHKTHSPSPPAKHPSPIENAPCRRFRTPGPGIVCRSTDSPHLRSPDKDQGPHLRPHQRTTRPHSYIPSKHSRVAPQQGQTALSESANKADSRSPKKPR